MAANQAIDNTILNEISNQNWIRQSLLVPTRGFYSKNNSFSRTQDLQVSGQFSYQQFSFADTSLGGNRSMNPKPQFTKFADPLLPSLITSVTGINQYTYGKLTNIVTNGQPGPNDSMGMGRYYAEAIDQHEQRIFMQFGAPMYNSLTNFFDAYYDEAHGNLVASGSISAGILDTVGKFIGYITLWTIMPVLSVSVFLYNATSSIMSSLTNIPKSKFYYMKPTMATYWTMVTTIMNAITVNMGLANPLDPTNVDTGATNDAGLIKYGGGVNDNSNAANMAALANVVPKYMLNDSGTIDWRQVACRYQRLADAHMNAMTNIQNSYNVDKDVQTQLLNYLQTGIPTSNINTTQPIEDYLGNQSSGTSPVAGTTTISSGDSASSSSGYINSASGTGEFLNQDTDTSLSVPATGDKAPDDSAATAKNNISNSLSSFNKTTSTTISNYWNGVVNHLAAYSSFATAELRQGSAYVSFIVDWEQHVSESFSSSTKQSSIADTMNATAQTNRDRMYSLAGGHISDSAFGTLLQGIVGGVTELASDAARMVGFSGLSQLGGKAFVDIPDFWDSSSSSFPTSSYSIHLGTPYGNSISVLLNIMPTLAMILAGAVPRSTGKSSYGSPFLCRLWQRGRTQIQLGIITNLSITRGTGNVGWNIHNQAIAIDINFTVTNLNKILHMPVSTDISLGSIITKGYTSMCDEDTPFTDYMGILAGLKMEDQIYSKSRWRLRRQNAQANIESFLSIDNLLTHFANETLPGSIMSSLSRQATLSENIL